MMKCKGYLGKTEVDDENSLIHGEVLGIRDVVTFQADSVKGLRKAFEDSVNDYLAFCKERGEKPNKPFSGRFLLRIDEELHRQADMVAIASGKSLNTLVTECLSSFVRQKSGSGIATRSVFATGQRHRRTRAGAKAGVARTRR